MNYYKLLSLLIVFFFPLILKGQATNLYFDLQHDRGNVLLTNDFVASNNAEEKPLTFYSGLSIRLLFQGNGNKNWQRSFRLPYYGIGIGARDFRSEELGKSYSGYGILGIPVFRTEFVEFFTEIEYGIAFGWKHYDPLENPFNRAIGSKFTVHAGIRPSVKIHLGNHLDLNIGASFLHFSNGKIKRPNNGLNIITFSSGFSYQPKNRIDATNITKAEKEDRTTEFAVATSDGIFQTGDANNKINFSVAGLNLSLAKRHTNIYQSRVGMDLNYIWSLTTNEDGNQAGAGTDNFTVGFIYQPEVIISKFTLVGGLGIYARHESYNSFKKLYQRLGLRYNIVDWISVSYNIRSVNFYQAEFLEFQVGFHL